MSLPSGVKYLVIGAGIHGLSTAWHLAKEQRAAGQEPDVLVIDKTGVGAGASGIACGVVRNNYIQPAMSELMAANVEVWEQDPAAFSFHEVGYIALGAERQIGDLTEVSKRHEAIGYPSELIVGEAEVRDHMKAMFPDWRAQGVHVALHEQKGGFANNMASLHGLAAKAKEAQLARARAKDPAKDPEFAARQEARAAAAYARQEREAERQITKLAEREKESAERDARKAAEIALEAERAGRVTRQQAENLVAQKAARDARYAARKARKK